MPSRSLMKPLPWALQPELSADPKAWDNVVACLPFWPSGVTVDKTSQVGSTWDYHLKTGISIATGATERAWFPTKFGPAFGVNAHTSNAIIDYASGILGTGATGEEINVEVGFIAVAPVGTTRTFAGRSSAWLLRGESAGSIHLRTFGSDMAFTADPLPIVAGTFYRMNIDWQVGVGATLTINGQSQFKSSTDTSTSGGNLDVGHNAGSEGCGDLFLYFIARNKLIGDAYARERTMDPFAPFRPADDYAAWRSVGDVSYESVTSNLKLTGQTADVVGFGVEYESQTSNLKLTGQTADFLHEIFYDSQVGTLKLAGITADQVISGDATYESQVSNLALSGQTADYVVDYPFTSQTANLPLVGGTADVLFKFLYDATPGILVLTGQTADVSIPLTFESVTGNLKLGGAVATVVFPDLEVEAPSGVRRAYPRRVQILGRRYYVKTIEDELRLLRQAQLKERQNLENPPKTEIEKKATIQARVRLRRTAKRVKAVEEAKERRDYLRARDEEIVTILADSWL